MYFRVKRFGPAMAVGISTAAVFVTTWLLHSYQWFWLRGGFPMTLPDALFWGILGALVVRGALKELRATKAPKRSAERWSFRLGLRAATTFFLFCLLWSLWSTESVNQWIWMLSAAGSVDTKGIALVAATFIVIGVARRNRLGGQQAILGLAAAAAPGAQLGVTRVVTLAVLARGSRHWAAALEQCDRVSARHRSERARRR